MPKQRRALEDVVWDAVTEQLSVDPAYDHDGAVKAADEAKQLMLRGRQYDDAANRAARRAARADFLWRTALWTFGVAVLAVGIFSAVFFPIKSHANDYAHTDPASVSDGAFYFIKAWYGENDLPPGLIQKAQTHSTVDGHKAWLTRWQARNGKKVCVYVWGKSNTGTPHRTYGRVANCP